MTPRERIRRYVKSTGIKQKTIAEKAGYSETEFSALMTGRKKMDLDDLEKICTTLDVGADEFIRPQARTG